MTKTELAETLREETGLTKKMAEDVVEMFFDEMISALAEGERVEIRGFCNFFVKEYGGYVGRNPKTGEHTQVSPKRLPFFKCGKELKDRVDRH